MKRVSAFFALMSFFGVCHAIECDRTGRPSKTPYGVLTGYSCEGIGEKSFYFLDLDGKKILQDSFLAREDLNQGRSVWVYAGGGSVTTGCAKQLYLLDLAKVPVKIFAFGVRNACNEFHWASWGEKRSVIALKKNVSFVYESGKLTPPPAGAKLWNDIEAPHAGQGLKEEDAIPFVEELKLP